MAKKSIDIPTVKVIYTSTNKARHPVSGTTIQPSLGRSLSYGWRKIGDVFSVAVADVIARPDLYMAFPCGEPFIIKGTTLGNPCQEPKVAEKPKAKEPKAKVVVPQTEADQLDDIPGIGKTLAGRLYEGDVTLFSEVAAMTEEQMDSFGFPKRTKSLVKKWQNEWKEQ